MKTRHREQQVFFHYLALANHASKLAERRHSHQGCVPEQEQK
jgi:hypothetical protein